MTHCACSDGKPMSFEVRIPELIERQQRTLEFNVDMIRHVDSKTGFVVALNTALIAAIAAVFPEPTDATLGVVLIALMGVACPFLSLALCWKATFPQTDGPDSTIFFGRIARRSLEEYCSKARSLDPYGYLDDLLKQTHVNATIANSKYCHVRSAMRALFIGVVPWTIAVSLLYGR